MNSIEKVIKYTIKTFCWVVKGIGVAVLLLLLAIFIGEGPPNPFKLTARELFLMVMLLTTLVGVALAVWRQLIGGIVVLAGITAFTIFAGIEQKYWENLGMSLHYVFIGLHLENYLVAADVPVGLS